MADILIQRPHTLGLAHARAMARRWEQQAQEKYQLACTYSEGEAEDVLSFERAGASGTLTVTGTAFTLNTRLGFLLSAFKTQIEVEMNRKLDALVRPDA